MAVAGAGRGLEHVTVDWLQGVLLVSLFREPTADELAALDAMLRGLGETPAWAPSGAEALLLQHRYLPDSAMQALLGEVPEERVVSENGLRYLLTWGASRTPACSSTCAMAASGCRRERRGQRVLNLFAYTCGFSVAAIAGGAARVVNLDMAQRRPEPGRDNHRLNDHDLSRVEFLGHDLFKSWGG
jgi:23S rRNA (cytosine1962-C5)-methyltransferase